MLSHFAEKKEKGVKKGVRQLSKSVVRVPRGCFGNDVRSRPCDLVFTFLFFQIDD